MAIHSTTRIPPPHLNLRLLENSSTTDDLNAVLKFIHAHQPLELDPNIRIRFWIIGAIMLLITVLYFIRLVKAVLDRDFYRIIERNKNGYLNPNVEVLVPIFSILCSTLGMCSIISLERDDGRYLSQCTLSTQIFSYIFLFFCAVTRVWKTLSVIPIVPIQITPSRRSLLTSGVPPFVFNAFVIFVYISFPMATLPLALKVTTRIAILGKEIFEHLPDLKAVVAQSESASPDDIIGKTLMEEVVKKLQANQLLLNDLSLWWRLICAIYLVYSLSLFITFIYASARLYSTLTIQIEILGQARRRFARMASAGMRSFEEEAPFDTSQLAQSDTKYHKIQKLFRKLKESVRVHSQGQSNVLEFWDSPDSCTENAELVRKFRMSRSYRTIVVWQWLWSSMIFLAFLSLAFCLTANVFHEVPQMKIILIIHEWAGWAWTIPGCALALLTCCVALMQHSDLDTVTDTLPTSSIHKHSPRDHRFPSEFSRTSGETEVVNLRSYTSFLPGTPTSSTKQTITGDFKLLGTKIWANFQKSQPCPTSPELPRSRKFSCFSITEGEKAEDPKPPPEFGFHIHKESSGAPLYNYQVDPDRVALPSGTSDVTIIKSLRDRDS